MGWLDALRILHFRNRKFRRFSFPLNSKVQKEFDENCIERHMYASFYTNFDAD